MDSMIYFDNNATTPIDELVLQEIQPYLYDLYGNPNANYAIATATHDGLKLASDRIYKAVNAHHKDSIIMTSCATESINSVHKSVLLNFIKNHNAKNIVITSSSEHPSMQKSLAQLTQYGIELIEVEMDTAEALDNFNEVFQSERVLFVSMSLANHETGIVRPLRQIAEICHAHQILIHADATQAIGKIALDIQDLNVDFMSFSGHKFHAPKGIGGLYIKQKTAFTPLLLGGSQMGGFRSGTLNVMGIVGMGKAIEIATTQLASHTAHLLVLKQKLEQYLLSIPNCHIHGQGLMRLPNTTFFYIDGIDNDMIVWHCTTHNIAVSTGSACTTKSIHDSIHQTNTKAGVRISLSKYNTIEEIEYFIEIMKQLINK